MHPTRDATALAALAAGGEPEYHNADPSRPFSVGGPPDTSHLPLDWSQDPYAARSWRFELHTLHWLRPGDGLERARDVALDWIAQNPLEGAPSEFAWYDMAVGRRAPKLAYVARACASRGLLSETDADTLLRSIREHGNWLADDANYTYGHNHGLFQDEGLLATAGYLSELDEARRWRDHARERFEQSLRECIHWEDAFHLEHSPGYHFTITNMLGRIEGAWGLSDELTRLLERMRETACWLVAPDGTLPQVGDTHRMTAPRWVEEVEGLRSFHGAAVSRFGDSYLYVTAGYHSGAHKQADELSFVLYEGGREVVCDTGLYSYDERDPMRIRARSSEAHNCLVVDNQSFDWRSANPYGSGILRCGEVGPWRIIEATNPLVPVEHVRTFFHRPGLLVVHDQVKAAEPHRLSRFVHVPEGAVVSVTDGSDCAVERIESAGWTSPRFRQVEPTTTVELACTAASASLLMQIRAEP